MAAAQPVEGWVCMPTVTYQPRAKEGSNRAKPQFLMSGMEMMRSDFRALWLRVTQTACVRCCAVHGWACLQGRGTLQECSHKSSLEFLRNACEEACGQQLSTQSPSQVTVSLHLRFLLSTMRLEQILHSESLLAVNGLSPLSTGRLKYRL